MQKFEKGEHDNLIQSKVSEMSFQDEFKPFIVEFLRRRAFQYDYTDEQVSLDLDRLSKSLLRITTKNKGFSTCGTYYASTGTINMNHLYSVSESNINLFDTLAHESSHACATEDGKDTMGGYNIFTENYNSTLLEVLISKAASRLVRPSDTSNPYLTVNRQSGYQKMHFASDMIAATFGVPENEMLGVAIQGRDKLIDYLARKSHTYKNLVFDFLNHFELNLAILHRNLYGDSKEKDKIMRKGKNISEAMGHMRSLCAETMLECLKYARYVELTPERIQDLKFNYNKLLVASKKGSKGVKRIVGYSQKRVNELSNDSLERYANAIALTECLEDYKKEHVLPEDYGIAFDSPMREGYLNKFDEAYIREAYDGLSPSDLGIQIPERLPANHMFDISEEVIKRNQLTEDKIVDWDNSIINELKLRRLLIKTHNKDIFNSFKTFITGKKPKELPPAIEDTKEMKPQHEEPEIDVSSPEIQRKINEFRARITNLPQTNNNNGIGTKTTDSIGKSTIETVQTEGKEPFDN